MARGGDARCMASCGSHALSRAARGRPNAYPSGGKGGPGMAKDIQDRVGQILESDTARHIVGAAVDEALKGLSKARSSGTRLGRKSQGGVRGAVSGVRNTLPGGSDGGGMSGMRTLAAGAGAAALAPVAAKGIGKLIKGGGAGALVGGPKKVAEGAA